MIQNKTSIVVGSNGFLGRLLSERLSKVCSKTIGVYHKQIANLYDKITHLSIDEITSVTEQIDWVFITSAYVPGTDTIEETERLYQSNVKLVGMLQSQFKSAKLIYCSSVSVYGAQVDAINENNNIAPNSPYALSKRWGELIVEKHSKFSIVRISSMYGVGMKKNTFIPLAIQKALETGTITIFGDGSRKQNYVSVQDVITVLIEAASHSENNIFLATGDNSIENKTVANYILDCLPNTTIEFTGEDTSSSYLYDNSKTLKLLNLQKSRELSSEIKEVIQWMQK